MPVANAELYVPVDGKGFDWPRRVANAVNSLLKQKNVSQADFDALAARVSAAETAIAGIQQRTNLGWIDYTDTTAGTATALTPGTATQITRTLTASAANNRLRGVFDDHQFWHNDTSRIIARGLYDVIMMSLYLAVSPGASGGVLDVQLMAGAIDIGSKAFEMTGAVGTPKGIRADFIIAVRNGFLTNGVKVMLTASVPTDLIEFSPEFYPMSVEP